MTIQHHLPDDLLLTYAAANLAEAWSLVVATHLSLCPACRRREAQLSAIGGVALEDFAPASISDTALVDCLARLDDEPIGLMQTQTKRDVIPAGRSILPQPLREYAGGDVDALGWSYIGFGLRQHILPLDGGPQARLLRVREGIALPEHGHRGLELTLVLAGSFSEGGKEFRRGDIAVADEEVEHIQVVGRGEPCICLTVADAPLIFHQWLPRLAQRFAKI